MIGTRVSIAALTGGGKAGRNIGLLRIPAAVPREARLRVLEISYR